MQKIENYVPFACRFTPNIPELLLKLNCSILISTYQAGKIIIISPKNENELIQLPRTFAYAMGIAVSDNKIAIALKDEIIVNVKSSELARTYPPKSNVYDSIYIPTARFITGQVDMHDIHWGKNDKIWAVNSSFSCIVSININYNFYPEWKPFFIDDLVSEDRCHLNSMAMDNGMPVFISALGKTNSRQKWKENLLSGGIIIDIKKNEIIAEGLSMPHSLRLHNNKIYFLQSASGTFCYYDISIKSITVLKELNCFVRGLAIYNNFAFIGYSKLRQNSSVFKDLEIAKKSNYAGIIIIHIPTNAIIGKIEYQNSVDEIYDVQILPGTIRPNILNTVKDTYKKSLIIPGKTFWAK